MISWEHTAVAGFGACCLLGFDTVSVKIVEDGVIPEDRGSSLKLNKHPAFSEEVSLAAPLKRAALGQIYLFPVTERWGSCLNAWLPPQSPGWVSTWLLLLPPVGPLHQHPPSAQPKVVTGSFTAHLFPCHRPASPWHLLQPVTFLMLLFITVI